MRRGLAASTKRSWIEDLYFAESFEVASVERQYLVDPVYAHHGDQTRIVRVLSRNMIGTHQPFPLGENEPAFGQNQEQLLQAGNLPYSPFCTKAQAVVFERSGSDGQNSIMF
jgi:hypothetical protein